MAIRVVQLGTVRANGEGIRIGAVRRPPRGVPREYFASEDWFDVFYPNLAPSADLLKWIHHAPEGRATWATFVRRYREEMATTPNAHSIALLAALSHESNFSVGCFCDDEARCHRSILRQLLADAGATFHADSQLRLTP